MEKIVRNFTELAQFCKDNGYIVASYKINHETGNWELYDTCATCYDDYDDVDIFCKVDVGQQVSYRETESIDGEWFFVLHNNFNLKQSIPCLEMV